LTWAYALLIAIASISWFCGWFDAFNNLIYARQRFDYQNIIGLLGTVASILVTYMAITALKQVFPNTTLGVTTAGAIGIGIGGLGQTVLQWAVSYYAIGKLKITLGKPLLSFKYSPTESKMMVKYGTFMMLQDTLNSLTAVGGFLWVIMIQTVIPDPVALATAIGFWNIGFNYTGVLGYSGLLSTPLFPAISESHAARDYKLRDRYIAISFKWAFSIGVPETLVYIITAYNLIVGFTGTYWAPSVPILMFGLTGVFISNIGGYLKSIANGVGLTRLPFYYSLIQLILMPLTLYGFVWWFAFENFPGVIPIAGAAFALITQQAISTIILWVLLRRNLKFHIPSWVAWFPLTLGLVLLVPFVAWITPWVNATVPLWIGAIILIAAFLGIYFLCYLILGGLTPGDFAIARDIFKGNKMVMPMLDGVEKFVKHSPFYGKFNF
jgi:O-antigen/teichoic acid export membrane protein